MKFITGTMVLAMAVSAPAVYAGEAQPESTEEAQPEGTEETPAEDGGGVLGGLLTDLFGEDGPLSVVLSEQTAAYEMLDTAKEQLGQAGAEVSGVLDAVVDAVKNEAGSLDAETLKEYAEDGENYMPSIEAMCSETGTSLDECLEDIEFADAMMVYDLETYLENHPEVAGIEYDGEIRTAEELDELWIEKFNEEPAEGDGKELTEETEASE